MVQQLSRPAQYTIAPEVLLLAKDKTIASKVLTWDACLWGTGLGYMPSEIENVLVQHDTFLFKLTGDRAIPISAEQFIGYYNSIKVYEAEMQIQDAEQEAEACEAPEPIIGSEPDIVEMQVGQFVETRIDEDEEIQWMQAAELELQPQQENPNTAWYRDLERAAAVKGYRVVPYDGLIRKAIVYGRAVKAYIQFTLVSDKWAVAFTFNGQPKVFDRLEEAIAFIEANDAPPVLIEPWVFDKAS